MGAAGEPGLEFQTSGRLGGLCLCGAHGKFSPGASNNVGSGYWGNNFATGTTFYVTKNKGTSLNLATNWEIHGQKERDRHNAGRGLHG